MEVPLGIATILNQIGMIFESFTIILVRAIVSSSAKFSELLYLRSSTTSFSEVMMVAGSVDKEAMFSC